MKDLEQIKNYLVPGLVFIVVLAMIPIFILPTLNRIAEASKTINQNQTRLNGVKQKASDLEELKGKESDLREKLTIAESALPIDKSVAPLVLGVKDLAVEKGLSVKSFKIQPGKTATESAKKAIGGPTGTSNTTGIPKLTSQAGFIFQMVLIGKTADFKSFVAALESAKRLLLVQEFKGISSDGANYEIEVFINAPFSPLPEISEDQEAAALPKLTAANEKLLEDLKSSIFTDRTAKTIEPGSTGVTDPFK